MYTGKGKSPLDGRTERLTSRTYILIYTLCASASVRVFNGTALVITLYDPSLCQPDIYDVEACLSHDEIFGNCSYVGMSPKNFTVFLQRLIINER